MHRHAYHREHIFCLIPEVKRQKVYLSGARKKGALNGEKYMKTYALV